MFIGSMWRDLKEEAGSPRRHRGHYNWRMGKCLAILFVSLAVTFAISQDPKPLADAGVSICSENAGGGKSAWVTSNNGLSAAVELRRSITGSGAKRNCVTSWVLQVHGQKGSSRTIVVAKREDGPEDNEWIQENSFWIDAWSTDGNMVLTSQIEAQGDWDETTPVVYDFRSGKFWRVEVNPLFEKHIPRDCYVVYRPLGFSKNGNILIRASSTDNDREEGTKRCFPESTWRLDFHHKILLPPN